MANRFTPFLALFTMRGSLPPRLRVPAFLVAALLLVVTLVVSMVSLWKQPVTSDTIALITLFVLVALFILNAAKEPDPGKADAVKRYISQRKEEEDEPSGNDVDKR